MARQQAAWTEGEMALLRSTLDVWFANWTPGGRSASSDASWRRFLAVDPAGLVRLNLELRAEQAATKTARRSFERTLRRLDALGLPAEVAGYDPSRSAA